MIEDFHYLDDDGVTRLPVNIDFNLNRNNPELNRFCEITLGLSATQITQADAEIGSEDGMFYTLANDSFSPVPMPNTRYNSIDGLFCRVTTIPQNLHNLLTFTATNNADGSTTFEAPKWVVNSTQYPIQLHYVEQIQGICVALGFGGVQKSNFSVGRLTQPFWHVYVNAQLWSDMLYIEPHTVNAEAGDVVTLLERFTCGN